MKKKTNTIRNFARRAAMMLLLSVLTTATAWADDAYQFHGTAGTAGANSSQGYDKLFDFRTDTKWCVTNFTSCYVEFYTEGEVIPHGYILTTGDDCAKYNGRNPKSWVIKAKRNQGDAWTTLVTVTNNTTMQDVNSTDYSFTLNNSNIFKYFRFEVSAVQSGTVFQLSRLQFTGNQVRDLSRYGGTCRAENGDVLTGANTFDETLQVRIAAGATVTLDGVNISQPSSQGNPGITCEGDATIILVDGTTNNVSGGGDRSGIFIPQNHTLTIRGEGSLNANCTNVDYGAGIGADKDNPGGNIVIESGVINAKGHHGAGIGATQGSSCGNITISGGTVTATGGDGGAGIGAAESYEISGNHTYAPCGNITISGGTVTANGGENGAGIGAGKNSICGDITISGGTVNATGGYYAAGIGGGSYGDCGNIIITNGVTRVTVAGGLDVYGYMEWAIGSSYRGWCTSVTIGGVSTGSIIQETPFVTYPYKVAFNKNGGTGSMASQNFMYNVAQNLTANSYTWQDCVFIGWATSSDGAVTYTDGQSVSNLTTTTNATVTLYAVWKGGATVLADGTAYTRTTEYAVTSATYRKTIDSERVGKHQAWLVPFDYTIKSEDLDKFQFYKINMIANSPDPSVETTDEMWVFVTRLNAGDVLRGNLPYVYKPLEAVTDYGFTTENATLMAKNTGVIAETQTMEDVYSFYATYENTTATDSDPFYYVSINGGITLGNDGTVTVGPYRWIIRKTSKYGGTPSYAPRMRFFDGEDGVATGINGLESLHEADGQWFDLNGRRLADMPTHKGIYICGGRKVVVR